MGLLGQGDPYAGWVGPGVSTRPKACEECGSYFQPHKLEHRFVVEVRFGPPVRPPFTQIKVVYYCQTCAPPAPLLLVLRDDTETISDILALNVANGWFQVFDEDTGEERYIVTHDEYNHTFCRECGELIEEELCQRHRPKVRQHTRRSADKSADVVG